MIYISPLRRVKPEGMWRWDWAAHLIADTPKELVEAAKRFRLKPWWRDGDQYDITVAKHKMALRLGASELPAKEFAAKRKEIRKRSQA